jgi:hypothetical protein
MRVSYSKDEGEEYAYKWPSQKSMVLWIAETYCTTSDIYICPSLRAVGLPEARRQGNGLCGRAAWVDVDKGRIPDWLSPYLDLVKSGTPGHFHAYAPLAESVSPDMLQGFNHMLMEACNGDSKWANNSVLRLPGTFNHKTTPPEPVELVQTSLGRLTEFALAKLLRRYPVPSGVTTRTDRQVSSLRIVEIPASLPKYIVDCLNETPQPGKGEGRSGQTYYFVRSCAELGYSLDEIYSMALQHAPTVEKHAKRSKGIEEEVCRIYNKAVGS